MGARILAFDLGTTGNKATLFDETGRAVASAFRPYETIYPRAGWAEQRADDWWNSVCESSKELVNRDGIDVGDIAAVGFSGHMMGCLPVDANGEPLSNSLIHSDGRSEPQCAALREMFGDEDLYRFAGNRIAPQYTLPKIMWLAENHPQVFSRTAKFLQAKDYIALRFTGRLGITDYSDASLAGLLDIKKREYAADLLEAAGVPRHTMPEIVPAATVIGTITREAAAAAGLREGTPVVIGGGDGACATVGAGALAPGEAYNYGGGTSWISMVADRPLIDPEMRIFNLLDLDPAKANVLGTMQCAGSSFEWFADEVGALETEQGKKSGENRFETLSRMAAEISPGSGRLFFLPYLMGERAPIWDSRARGVFFGLSLSHTRAHMARSVLEGIAYALRSICDVLEDLGGSISSLSFIGGMSKGATFGKILASVLGKRLLLPSNPGEATSRGAAIAAAVATGILPSYADARRWIPVESEIEPDPDMSAKYEPYYEFYRSLYPALRNRFGAAAELPE
jgi:xylulokinase